MSMVACKIGNFQPISDYISRTKQATIKY